LAGTIAGTLNQESGSNSRILIKVYKNCGLCSKFIRSGLKHRNRNQTREKIYLPTR